ncbi:NADP-reducing hydrogenase, subunit B [Thermodesulfobium narugense DSM 14796]|uniref:NADP-reducing hydrogenase, subunit B n=1 Tax=Thermodesulfobium narugense DSM 14796 TaxID=747365 RepID=M1E8T6_9BACT|nr:hypothetical protein [Thermodesulfobium narugense]AEE14669.1 NADP-reducing hydrogenase, subunit B [Thermodesulfobium narugense DSM 14796]
MKKIESLDDLHKLKEQSQMFLKTRLKEIKFKIYLNLLKNDDVSNSRKILQSILDELQKNNFFEVQILGRPPINSNIKEPFIAIEKGGKISYFTNVNEDIARKIITSCIFNE